MKFEYFDHTKIRFFEIPRFFPDFRQNFKFPDFALQGIFSENIAKSHRRRKALNSRGGGGGEGGGEGGGKVQNIGGRGVQRGAKHFLGCKLI